MKCNSKSLFYTFENRGGSVIVDAEVILVQDSEELITEVLEEISTTGIIGNLSIVPGSLNTSAISGEY